MLHDDVGLSAGRAHAQGPGNADGAGCRHLPKSGCLGLEHGEPVCDVELDEVTISVAAQAVRSIDAAAANRTRRVGPERMPAGKADMG